MFKTFVSFPSGHDSYKEITRRGTSYIQQKEGRLTALVASCVETAG